MPAEMFPDALFGKLTADIQAGNETALLELASAAARPALTTWWDNLRAIGFTTGAVIPTASLDAVHINTHGDGTAVVLAGAHSPLDPVDVNGNPQIPMEHYRIGLHFASPTATGQITSWQPLDDTPWDGLLYIRKAAHVVVAGPPSEKALVDATLPVAEAAAAYDVEMMHKVAPGFLLQHGFVVFVSSSATVRSSWLTAVPQPQGWPPEFLGTRLVQLPGPGVTADYSVGTGKSTLVNVISDDSMGGVRVVLAPGVTTTTLVREFMLAIGAPNNYENLAYSIPHKPIVSWTQVGMAVMVQSLYEGNPDPVPSVYNFALLTAKLRALPPSYRNGHLPSSQELFGPSLAADEKWGYVAASGYEYIDSRYNLSRAIVASMVEGSVASTPFGNIYKSGSTAKNIKFFGIHSIRQGWLPWLARL
jgi:hypothetical protein